MSKSLVLFSGGLDSYLTLLIAKQTSQPTAVFLDYGQNMLEQELEASIKICAEEGVPLVVRRLDTNTLGFFGGVVDKSNDTSESSMIDSPLTPNRNLTFITLIANYAIAKGVSDIYLGFQDEVDSIDDLKVKQLNHIVDYRDIKEFLSKYELRFVTDQSTRFLSAMQLVLDESTEGSIKLISPLVTLTKGDILKKINDLGKLDDAIRLTRSCYSSTQRKFYWGYGCDNCPTCKFRKLGYLKGIVNTST